MATLCKVLPDESGVDQTVWPKRSTSRRADTGAADPRSTLAMDVLTCSVRINNSAGVIWSLRAAAVAKVAPTANSANPTHPNAIWTARARREEFPFPVRAGLVRADSNRLTFGPTVMLRGSPADSTDS